MKPTPRTDEKGFDPTALLVASVEGGPYWTISQVVEITGVPYSTLKNWSKTGKIKAPSQEAHFGERKIHLYTAADLEEIKGIRRNRRPVTVKRAAA